MTLGQDAKSNSTEIPKEELWVLFNCNRKGTVLYFSDHPNGGAAWGPSPLKAKPLPEEVACRLGVKFNSIAVKASWLRKVEPREIAGQLRANYERAKNNQPVGSMIRNFLIHTAAQKNILTRLIRERDREERAQRRPGGGTACRQAYPPRKDRA